MEVGLALKTHVLCRGIQCMIRIKNGSVVGARAQREVQPHLGPGFSKLPS